MKYKSELIKNIVDTRGHKTPLLHYESECVEKWIKEVKGAYPKLCDYQSEWLNYINENPLGVFPYITLSNVTNATVENVVPYEYKSAILKGQTLVNIALDYNYHTLQANGTTKSNICKFNSAIKPSTAYLVVVEIKENTMDGRLRINVNGSSGSNSNKGAFNEIIIQKPTVGIHKIKATSLSSFDGCIGLLRSYLYNDNTTGSITYRAMIIEYQEGMENWDIPYFEGMQSVKMPVLTTTGKNLFDEEWESGSFNNTTGVEVTDSNTVRSKNYISVEPNKNYTFDVDAVKVYYDREYNVISVDTTASNTKRTITTPSNCHYVRIRMSYVDNNNKNLTKQFEEGYTSTSYEPFKSNILTVNEEVELRGIGDVKDELDLTTGKLTQRIGEVVLDGSEDWIQDSDTSNQNITISAYVLRLIDTNQAISTNIICERFQSKNINTIDEEGIYIHGSKGFRLRISIDKLSSPDINGFKTYLQSNPVTVQYLATESIKTVDLSNVDQDGNVLKLKPIEGTMHLKTNGEILKPTFTGEVPVEAITQNLASFIKLEMEE